MPTIINVLTDSLRMLREQPRFFVPKLVSTFLGALWAIGLFSGTGPLYLYAVTGLPLAALAMFVSVMLAAMVMEEDSPHILREGFNGAAERWREIAVSFLLFTLVAFAIYIPAAAGLVLFYLGAGLLPFIAGAALSLVLVLAFGFVSYFFPVSLLEKGSVVEGITDSALTSASNYRQVLPLTLFSFLLLLLATLTPDAGMKLLGYTGFFLMRLVSGIVTTYIFVVSPSYYLRS